MMTEEEMELRGSMESVPEERMAASGEVLEMDARTELPAPTAEESAAQEGGGRLEVDALRAERDQLIDRLARLQAEFDNARKRAEREQAEFRDYATGNVVEKFLPVIDNFELALRSTGSTNQLRSGVALIVKQMEEILRSMQVTPIATVGEPFDPRFHEALGSMDRDDLPDQQVFEEVRRGYKVREKLLRPALVRVAHNSKQVHE